MNAQGNEFIQLEQVIDRFPSSLRYMIKDNHKMNVSNAKWQNGQSYFSVRIPLLSDSNTFIHLTKQYGASDVDKVSIMKCYPIASGGNQGYTGSKVWLNLDNWTVYAERYNNGSVIAHKEPLVIARAGWHERALQHNAYKMDDNGELYISNGDWSYLKAPNQFACPNHNKRNHWDAFKKWFYRVLDGIADYFDNMPACDGTCGSSIGGGTGGGDAPPIGGPPPAGTESPGIGGGSWVPGGYSPGTPGTGGGGSWNDITPDPANPTPPPPSPPPHIKGIGGVEIGYGTPPIVIDYMDSNGFYSSRITALQAYVNVNPYGMIDCEDIENLPMFVFGEIGSFEPPVWIQNRINSMISMNSPAYNSSNTFIQRLTDGVGVVNMDFFPVHINTLPHNATGDPMTPLEFLEFFRKNLSPIFTNGNPAAFSPFQHYIAGSVDINENMLYNLDVENSIGAWVHIDIPLGSSPLWNNGTVIITDYYINTTTNHYYFTFTTMANLRDGTHPVCGNRRFGIMPHPGGGWQFYISGVDRLWDWYMDPGLGNFITPFLNGVAFLSADNLWQQVQTNINNYINNNAGSSSFFTPLNYKKRVAFSGAIKAFLQKDISLLELKNILECP